MAGFEGEIGAAVLRAKRQFPDHRPEVAYRVCLPVYELTLKVTEMAAGDLSTIARFVLQLAQAGIAATEEIGRLMGVDAGDVVSAAAELLAANLIVQRGDGGMEVTEDGRSVLRDGGRTLRPRNRYPKVPYDAATRNIVNMDIGRLLNREGVRKRGLFVAPVGPRRPRVNSIELEDVVDYDRMFGGRGRGAAAEMLEISAIRDVRLKYRDDVVMVKLDGGGSAKPAFAAYRAGQYLEPESAAMQRLAERGVELVPDELERSVGTMPWAHSKVVTSEESQLLEVIDRLDDGIGAKEREAAAVEAERGATLDVRERGMLADRVLELEAETDRLRADLVTAKNELIGRTSGETRLIPTEEHRWVLREAIDKANREVTLVSAWISESAFDAEIRDKLLAAMRRGARVRIGWGLGTNKRYGEGARNRERGQNLLSGLKRRVPKEMKERLVERRTETHEKFIICDDLFCAWGSFNWLSYRGERDAGYRRETSYYSERQEDIDLWKGNAVALFKENKRRA